MPEDPPPLMWHLRTVRSSLEGPAYPALIDTVRGCLDDLATAKLDDETIRALDNDMRAWRARLAPLRVEEDERMFGRFDDVPGRGQVMCPALAIDAQDATTIEGRVTFGPYFLGGNGAAHGGAVALLFDELFGIAANGEGAVARTAYLHVNYRAITPIDRELRVSATLVSVEGRKRIVRGELKDGDRLCADAEGLFLKLLPGQP